MAKLIYGEGMAKLGQLRTGCAAVIFDAAREKILLTRRTDNGQWCLPGGAMDSGESVTECCVRELREETGLHDHSLNRRLLESESIDRIQRRESRAHCRPVL
jgi:ADP-ribose pyrophosphatase YjhB (NUDIX family)